MNLIFDDLSIELQSGAAMMLPPPLHYLTMEGGKMEGGTKRTGRSRFFWCPLALNQPNTASSPHWEHMKCEPTQ